MKNLTRFESDCFVFILTTLLYLIASILPVLGPIILSYHFAKISLLPGVHAEYLAPKHFWKSLLASILIIYILDSYFFTWIYGRPNMRIVIDTTMAIYSATFVFSLTSYFIGRVMNKGSIKPK